jgi:phosphoserine aminotransferase
MTSSDEASYIVTGAWSKKAFQEGQKLGKVQIML